MAGLADDSQTNLLAFQELDDSLRKFFMARVPSADVEDLVQECFLKVSRGLPNLKDQERLAGWVFQIARNLVVDYFRSRRASLPLHIEVEASEGAVDSEESDCALQIGRWLIPMIEKLPEKYAETLRDSEIKGLPHQEIAERLGISVSGIKSRVQRGRVLLREKLQACCALKFDRRGAIRDFERRDPTDENCCGPDDCC